METKIKRGNIYLLIGFIVSVFVHVSILLALYFLSLKKPENKKVEKRKPIYVYITDAKEISKETKKIKKITPEGIPDKVVKRTNNKPAINPQKIKSKQVKHKKKNTKNFIRKKTKDIKKETKKEIKKENEKNKIKKKEIIKKIEKKETEEKKLEKISQDKSLQDIKETTSDDVNNKTEKSIENSNETSKNLTLASLKGKDEIFDIGKDEEQKKENIDDDIKKYIEALNRYLNTLSRRKDLYPPMAKRLRLEGSLIIKFKIRKDGSVDENSIQIVISSGYNVLDDGAIRIIKEYVPLFAKKYGKTPPKDIVVKLPITFQIIGW